MKKLLIGLAVSLLTVLLGAAGYLMATEFLPFDDMGKAVPVEAPAQPEEKTAKPTAPKIEVNKMKPVESTADILNELDYAYSQNRDTVGWLYIPGTDISNSVLQSFDNAYYLRRNEQKQDHIYGCYFADYTCNFGTRNELSPNTVIYGHSDLKDNPDSIRFSQLFRFTDQKFANKRRTIQFATREEPMVWQIFAVYYTDLNLDFNRSDFSGAELVKYAEAAKARSLYQYDVPVTEDDKVLTLVTCTIKYGADNINQRLIVAAKLMPEGWEQDISTPLEENPNPVQPVF